jgi:hypothetical protein
MEMNRIEKLYWALSEAHPHPFEWMGGLKRPRLLQRWRMALWKRNIAIFAEHGFILTDTVADRFRLAEPQAWNEDCGGAIIRQLTTALAGQVINASV